MQENRTSNLPRMKQHHYLLRPEQFADTAIAGVQKTPVLQKTPTHSFRVLLLIGVR